MLDIKITLIFRRAYKITLLMSCLVLFPITALTKPTTNLLSQSTIALVKIQYNLSRIANYMGIEPELKSLYKIKQANQNNLYSQAKRLAHKTDQLYFEITAQYSPLSSLTRSNKQKSSSLLSTYSLIQQINKTLLQLLQYLNIQTTLPAPQHNTVSTVGYNTVLEKLMTLNQNINQLLERQTQPADVYRHVTLAIYYADTILNTMPGSNSKIQSVPFKPNKQPYDVYVRLRQNLKLLSEIGAVCHIKVIDLQQTQITPKDISPNDVEEIAHMNVTALTNIAEQLNISFKDIQSYHPGKRFPSHVLQRSELLALRLKNILNYMQTHPSWTNEHCHDKK